MTEELLIYKHEPMHSDGSLFDVVIKTYYDNEVSTVRLKCEDESHADDLVNMLNRCVDVSVA